MRGQSLEDLIRDTQAMREQQQIKEQFYNNEWNKSQQQQQQMKQFGINPNDYPNLNTGSIWM